jgi:oligopeptidase A
VLSPVVGREYLERVLSRGNSAPPEQLFRDFMGRDPELNALLERNGMAVG